MTKEQMLESYREADLHWWQTYTATQTATDKIKAELLELKARAVAIRNELIDTYGVRSAEHPECDRCLAASVFGGPTHDPSPLCRAGKRPHCSCSTCF